MLWIRTGHAARLVAVFFLLWTGVDLINPSLCTIDRRSESSSARSGSSALLTDGSIPATPDGGAEDCFCCCHHLVSAAAWVPLPQVDLVQRISVPPVERTRVMHTRLDHPPQLA